MPGILLGNFFTRTLPVKQKNLDNNTHTYEVSVGTRSWFDCHTHAVKGTHRVKGHRGSGNLLKRVCKESSPSPSPSATRGLLTRGGQLTQIWTHSTKSVIWGRCLLHTYLCITLVTLDSLLAFAVKKRSSAPPEVHA